MLNLKKNEIIFRKWRPITHNQYNKTQRLNNSWRTYAIKIMQENKVMQEKKGTK